jgi:UDP-N-acetylmuramyl pentapeptide phosphotransferase/UDP-N-acetylglucosamine-1-phosphate transferase
MTADLQHAAVVVAVIVLASAALSIAAISLSLPWLKSRAIALPNARSAHREPTPQGGGLGVVLSTFATAWFAVILTGRFLGSDLWQLAILTGATGALTVTGLLDDIRSLPLGTRLAVQCLAVGILMVALPGDFRLVAELPLWLERGLIFVAGMWFVNLFNFMDGIDWMTAAEVVPVAATIVLFGIFDIVPALPLVVAAALLGAIFGFAPFNKPVARLFLGDVGSLPIGLLMGWLLLVLAASGHVTAALLLPLYYLADATLTLLRRTAQGESPWQAHRSHYYQRALDHGFTVRMIVLRVFAVNVTLAALAAISIAGGSAAISLAALTAGAALVGTLLWTLSRGAG